MPVSIHQSAKPSPKSFGSLTVHLSNRFSISQLGIVPDSMRSAIPLNDHITFVVYLRQRLYQTFVVLEPCVFAFEAEPILELHRHQVRPSQ